MEHQRIAIVILSLMIILSLFDRGFQDAWMLTLNLILSLLLFLTWVKSEEKKGGISFRINPVTLTLVSFCFISLLSLTYSFHPYSSLTEVMRFLSYFLLFFSISNLLDERGFRKAFYLIAICMSILSAHGLWQYFHGKEPEITSIFDYHGTLATYLLLSVPLCFALRSINVFFLLPGIIGALGLLISQSRSGYVSVVLSAFLFLPILARLALTAGNSIHRRKMSPFVPCLLIFLAIAVIFSLDFFLMESSLGSRILSLLSPWDISSAEARVKFWNSAIEISKDYFPAGTGIQTFYLIYPFFKHPDFEGRTHHFAHNDYLQLLSEVGVLGLLAFIGLIFAFFLTLRNGISGEITKQKEKSRACCEPVETDVGRLQILLAIYFGMLAFFINSLFEFNIYIPSLMIIVSIYLAYVSKGKGKPVTITPVRYPLIYILLICLIILSSFPYIGQIFLGRGEVYLKTGNKEASLRNYSLSSFFSPLNYLPHRDLALIYLEKGEREKALKQALRALRLNPLKKENHDLVHDIIKSGT